MSIDAKSCSIPIDIDVSARVHGFSLTTGKMVKIISFTEFVMDLVRALA